MRCRIASPRPLLEACSLQGYRYQLDPYIGCEYRCLYCYTLNQAKTDWAEEILIHQDLAPRLDQRLAGLEPQPPVHRLEQRPVPADGSQPPHLKQQFLAVIKMGRPLILPGGILAYVLGSTMGAYQQGGIDWGRAGLGFLITEVANLVAHYADEYADVDTDSLTRRTWFSGWSGVLPAGETSPVWALRIAVALAALAAGLTAYAVACRLLSWHVAWIVGLGLLAGWFYSMPPLALERRGWGELVNGLLGGILMPLMGYTAQTGQPSPPAVLALLPIFSMVMASLLAVHWADRKADRAVGKRSLVVILGERTRALHPALVALCYLSTLALSGPILPRPVCVAILATLPLALWGAATFTRPISTVSNGLAMAAVLLAASLGWIVAL